MCIGPAPQVGPSVARNQRFRKYGKDDVSFFRVEDSESGKALKRTLESLGGIHSVHGELLKHTSPLPESEEVEFVDKSPVYLDLKNVSRVHEPEHEERCVPILADRNRILKSESDFPEIDRKWDGGWHGTEASRLEYLRAHYQLWGFCSPEKCQRKTSVFFVPKKLLYWDMTVFL